MATKVLVVDDDLEINELLGEYLALENMRYVKAVSGGQGIHLAAAEHPDAIILDLMLPDIDGFEVARKLTTQRATFDIPIVILSCMCHEQDKEKGFRSGALFFMNKPFLPDDLLAAVRQALAWRAGLLTRVPAGTLWLGTAGESTACAKSYHQMAADLFSRTQLDDPTIAQMCSAIETLGTWAAAWKTDHPAAGRLRVDYDITDSTVAWRLSEDVPGLLADAFFQTARPKPKMGGAMSLMGWGGRGKGVAGAAVNGGSDAAHSVVVPGIWMDVLTKTGAAQFERDARTQTIRLVRSLGQGLNLVAGAEITAGAVPVVDVADMPPAATSEPRDLAAASNGV